MRGGFVFDRPPTAAAHASTIAATADGSLVTAWFGGSREGAADVGVWLARRGPHERWGEPVRVATGHDARGRPTPCWNPVLFQPRAGPLLLFWRVGPSPRRWWSLLARSDDGGLSWSAPERLPKGILGPIKNKPLELPSGALLCPSSSEHLGWRCHVEATPDLGRSWRRLATLNWPWRFLANQPTLLRWPDGRLQALCRTRGHAITECWSRDGGRRWSRMATTLLPNPNSGIDAVLLQDGRALLAYNHATSRRTPLNLALSEDGRDWRHALEIEDAPGEYSYPSIIQAADGMVHLTYTWNRTRIRHVELDPREL
ncbi:MAG TPA: sialidase family protein [Geminicoccaceae bacterium]|nr:sialidase family protein [Geminicoccaceae bacterium]